MDGKHQNCTFPADKLKSGVFLLTCLDGCILCTLSYDNETMTHGVLLKFQNFQYNIRGNVKKVVVLGVGPLGVGARPQLSVKISLSNLINYFSVSGDSKQKKIHQQKVVV